MVGEPLAEEPSTEMIDHLARYSRVLHVKVPLFLLLEHFGEQIVHHDGNVGCTVGSAELIVFLELVEAIPEVDDEVLHEFLSVATQIALDF